MTFQAIFLPVQSTQNTFQAHMQSELRDCIVKLKNNSPMKKLSPILLVLVLAGVALFPAISCKRDENPAPNSVPHEFQAEEKLLRQIDWSNGVTSNFFYNPDSSIHQRLDKSDQQESTTNFLWENGKMVEQHQSASLYTNKYEYNSQNQLVRLVNKYAELPLAGGYELVFSYDLRNLPSELHYYQVNEGGKELVYRSVYSYNNQNELENVTTFDAAGIRRFVFTVESWTESCQFMPWVFVSGSLHPLYMIYNLPVLSRMHRLPASIRKVQYNNNGSVHSETRFINTADVNGEHIEELTMETKYPADPSLDIRVTGHFIY